jgi:hypothetical protein
MGADSMEKSLDHRWHKGYCTCFAGCALWRARSLTGTAGLPSLNPIKVDPRKQKTTKPVRSHVEEILDTVLMKKGHQANVVDGNIIVRLTTRLKVSFSLCGQVTTPDAKTMTSVQMVFVTTQLAARAMVGCPYHNMLVMGAEELKKLSVGL